MLLLTAQRCQVARHGQGRSQGTAAPPSHALISKQRNIKGVALIPCTRPAGLPLAATSEQWLMLHRMTSTSMQLTESQATNTKK